MFRIGSFGDRKISLDQRDRKNETVRIMVSEGPVLPSEVIDYVQIDCGDGCTYF